MTTSCRVPEKVIQEQTKALLRTIGAKVYVIGRPPRRDATHKGTGIGVGLPDLYAILPDAPRYCGAGMAAHGLWIECKAAGGRLRPAQREFAERCEAAGIAHIVGGVDDVIAYLLDNGYLLPSSVPHYRLPEGRRSA